METYHADKKINPEKPVLPVTPPEYPVIKPDKPTEKETSEPFHPTPEINPVPQPEIKPSKE